MKYNRHKFLNKRKLILFVDLDETLVNSEWFNVKFNANDIHHSVESDGKIQHIKIRPHCHQFLPKLTNYFEMFVCTAAKRDYANDVMKIIDPYCKYFKRRLYTREDFINYKNKINFIETIFPETDYIIIFDNCGTMWEYVDNLIEVVDYRYFNERGIITRKRDEIDGNYLLRMKDLLLDIHQRFFYEYSIDPYVTVAEVINKMYLELWEELESSSPKWLVEHAHLSYGLLIDAIYRDKK